MLHYSGYQESNSRKNSGSSTNLLLLQKHNKNKRSSIKDDSREALGRKKANKLESSMIDDPMLDYSKSDQEEEEMKEVQFIQEDFIEEQMILETPEVKRLTKILNLIGKGHELVKEQVAIILANVTNSPYFKQSFLSS